MRQTIGMSVGGTTPTKIIVNGTTLDKCKVNGTDLIKTYAQLTLNISFYVECSAFSDPGSGSSCGDSEPPETEMYIESIKTTWSASGDKTISSISIAPVVVLKEGTCNAITTTYGTRVVVTSGQTITPTSSITEAEVYNSTIHFRCQLKSQTLIINFTDGTSVNYTLPDFSVQSDGKSTGSGRWAYTSFTFSTTVSTEWEV